MQTMEKPQAMCAECTWQGDVPAVAKCPRCTSRQLRRAELRARLSGPAERALFELRTAVDTSDRLLLAWTEAVASGSVHTLPAHLAYRESLPAVHDAARALLAQPDVA